MLTGKNPGKHGVFHFLKRKERSYDLEITSFNDVKESTIFSILSQKGIGSGVMNIPMTYPPPDDVSGFFVSGIPVPPQSRSYVVPNDLLEDLEGAGYRVDYDFRGFEPNREEEIERWADYEALVEGLFEIARRRVDIFLDLVEIEELPLLFFVISLTDRVQHYFWRFSDAQHPGFSEEGHRRFGDVIQRAYMLSDELVGKIVEKCGDEVDYLLVSDHGAGPHYGDFYLNGWLVENGFLKTKKIPRLVMKHAPLRELFSRLGVGFLTRIFPESVRTMDIPYPGKKRLLDATDIIWKETKAFASMHGIRVNLKGREPEGIVDEGGEYQLLIGQIKEALERLVNPLDGRKLLTECVSKEEAFSGLRLHHRDAKEMSERRHTSDPSNFCREWTFLYPRKRCGRDKDRRYHADNSPLIRSPDSRGGRRRSHPGCNGGQETC
jgi:predicted AlkP superfamily phosphohydrolase/phosphomutase